MKRFIVALLLGIAATGCHGWYTHDVTPETLVVNRQPKKVLVRRTDGSTVVLERPTMQGDTIVGTRRARGSQEQVRIPLGDVEQLATSETSTGMTVLLIAGIAGAVVLGALVFIGATYFPS